MIDRLFSFMPMAGAPVQAWFDTLSQLSVALRSQSAQHQSAASDLIERFVDFDAVRKSDDAAVHLGHQCAHRQAARVPAREDRRRCR